MWEQPTVVDCENNKQVAISIKIFNLVSLSQNWVGSPIIEIISETYLANFCRVWTALMHSGALSKNIGNKSVLSKPFYLFLPSLFEVYY